MPKMDSRRTSVLSTLNNNRIFILFGLVFVVMSLFAPRFFNLFNLTTITKTAAMNATIAIGFCIILITKQLDLSVGAIATFSAVVALGLKETIGYPLSVPLGILSGSVVGLINGLFVTKFKIHSFIVTIGMLTILQGVIFTVTGSNVISLATPDAFAIADFLAEPIIPLVSPRVLILVLLVIGIEIFLRRTQVGRNFFLVGGNKETAWLAGIKSDRYVAGSFVFSGTMSAIGGVLFAMEASAATLNLGDNSLLYVVAAVIIGGTSMAGGKGSVFKTLVAVLTLEVLYTGIILFGLGNEVKIFVAGLILALVILYEAYANWAHEKKVGQRPELLKELETRGVHSPT